MAFEALRQAFGFKEAANQRSVPAGMREVSYVPGSDRYHHEEDILWDLTEAGIDVTKLSLNQKKAAIAAYRMRARSSKRFAVSMLTNGPDSWFVHFVDLD